MKRPNIQFRITAYAPLVISVAISAIFCVVFAGTAAAQGRKGVLTADDSLPAYKTTVGRSAASNPVAGATPQHVVDFNGDGRTDFTVARDIGGSIVWFTYDGLSVPPDGITYNYYGLSAPDFIAPEDFDGDNKTDLTVWRPSGSTANFYILQSSDNTIRTEPFGQEGDDPAVVGDYDGDGKADPTVYRCPAFNAPAGQCSFFYRGSLNNPSGATTQIQWGFGNDGDFFPYVGDFDGDGKNDFCIQRSDPTNTMQAQFILLRSSDQGVEYQPWGFSSDFLVPGDYDGDGKTDFCVSRNTTGFKSFYVLLRTGAAFYQQWGSTGDTPTPGDYDGDGKSDFAVWRGSQTAGETAFYVLESGTTTVRAMPWGQCPSGGCDYPVANWPVH